MREKWLLVLSFNHNPDLNILQEDEVSNRMVPPSPSLVLPIELQGFYPMEL